MKMNPISVATYQSRELEACHRALLNISVNSTVDLEILEVVKKRLCSCYLELRELADQLKEERSE